MYLDKCIDYYSHEFPGGQNTNTKNYLSRSSFVVLDMDRDMYLILLLNKIIPVIMWSIVKAIPNFIVGMV